MAEKNSYLKPARLPELPWDDANVQASLEAVYGHVAADAQTAVSWYETSRKPKKYGGLIIRGTAVVLVSAAGLLPVLSQIATAQWKIRFDPLATSLAIGLAAALVGFDKYFGFSTGWMRYVTTTMQIRAALEAFEMDWTCTRASWRGNPPTPDQVDQALSKCKDFAAKLNGLVADETNQWVQEFQASLKQVDDAVKAAQDEAQKRVEAAKPGALNLTVSNAATLGGRFSVQVGTGAVLQFVGSSAAIDHLDPGLQRVRVFAVVNGNEHAQEKMVTVTSGAVANETFTL